MLRRVFFAGINPDHILGSGVNFLIGLAVDQGWPKSGPRGHQILLFVGANTMIVYFVI